MAAHIAVPRAPHTPHPAPCTLHPAPCTLNPAPWSRWAASPFDVSVLDCWEGLAKAMAAGLYSPESFDKNEYVYYDAPLNGDLHGVVKGKFFAFKGPTARRRHQGFGTPFTRPSLPFTQNPYPPPLSTLNPQPVHAPSEDVIFVQYPNTQRRASEPLSVLIVCVFICE